MQNCFVGVAGLQKSSFIDFPGHIATALFMRGCNLRCPYCHNPSIVLAKNEDDISPFVVEKILEERKNMIEAVVISGGEPTIHANLPQMASAIRRMGYKVKLDTNGLLPTMIDEVAPDYLALDIKTDPTRYSQKLGARGEFIQRNLLESIERVREKKENGEIRVTIAPGIVDDDAIRWIAQNVRGVAKVFLQEFKDSGDLLDKQFSVDVGIGDEIVGEYRKLIGEGVGKCSVRGE